MVIPWRFKNVPASPTGKLQLNYKKLCIYVCLLMQFKREDWTWKQQSVIEILSTHCLPLLMNIWTLACMLNTKRGARTSEKIEKLYWRSFPFECAPIGTSTPTSCCEKRNETKWIKSPEEGGEEMMEVGATEQINFFMVLTFNEDPRQWLIISALWKRSSSALRFALAVIEDIRSWWSHWLRLKRFD